MEWTREIFYRIPLWVATIVAALAIGALFAALQLQHMELCREHAVWNGPLNPRTQSPT